MSASATRTCSTPAQNGEPLYDPRYLAARTLDGTHNDLERRMMSADEHALRAQCAAGGHVLHADEANVLQNLLLSSEPLIAKTMLRPVLVEEPRERP